MQHGVCIPVSISQLSSFTMVNERDCTAFNASIPATMLAAGNLSCNLHSRLSSRALFNTVQLQY